MERIPVSMTRGNLDNIPEYPLPAGYKFRFFKRGEELVWAQMQVDVGAFESIEKAMERYNSEFAPHIDEFEKRCIFLVEESTGRVIGTTTAWYHPDRDDDRGRIHWVAIIPGFQGRKLAKPLLAEAMRVLRAYHHERVHLWSMTSAAKAIRMYLDFGFVPANVSERFEEAWAMLAEVIDHPALEAFREKS
ncbi:MAG: GNAT family N-acetyltransferase [Armatimonadota bacterium]